MHVCHIDDVGRAVIAILVALYLGGGADNKPSLLVGYVLVV